MEKKYFDAPEFEVLILEDDIIATSMGINDSFDPSEPTLVEPRFDFDFE